MKNDFVRIMGPVPYPPHRDTEYEGRPPEDAGTTDMAVRNALATISEIMVEDRRRRGSDILPDLAPPVEPEVAAPRPRRKRRAKSAQARRGPGVMAGLRAVRLRAQHLGWALAFGAALIWPKAVLIAAFALFCLTLIGCVLFGADRVQGLRARLREICDAGFPPGGMARLRNIWRGARSGRPTVPDRFADRPDPFERLAKDRH